MEYNSCNVFIGSRYKLERTIIHQTVYELDDVLNVKYVYLFSACLAPLILKPLFLYQTALTVEPFNFN